MLVVFGITGDLAKVMTFRSLYRLEQRGLLDCPIVGVAVDDWSDDQLRERAREVDRGDRREARQRGLRSLRSTALVRERRLRRRLDLRARRGCDRRRVDPGLLPRDPAVPLRRSRQGPGRGRADARSARRRREAVRPRSGIGRRAGRRDSTSTSTSPSSTASTTYLGKMGLEEILHLRFANSMFEPIWSRNHIACVQITMAEDFGVEDRGHFYDPVGALRDVVVNHLMQVVAASAMEMPARREPATDQGRPGRRSIRSVADADPAHYVRGQYDGYLDIEGVEPNSTTETYAALRLEIDNLALGRRAVLHPDRQASRGHPDGAAARLQACPEAWLQAPCHPPPEPNQLVVKLDPTTGIRLIVDAHRADVAGTTAIDAGHGVRRGGRRGPDALRGAAARGDARGTALASPARTASRRRGGSCSRCSTAPPRCTRLRAADRGARRRPTKLVAGHGRWHGPWVAA